MFIGACAGSTSGGIKVSRILILLKTIRKELSLIIHPRQVKKIRMDGHPVDHRNLTFRERISGRLFCTAADFYAPDQCG